MGSASNRRRVSPRFGGALERCLCDFTHSRGYQVAVAVETAEGDDMRTTKSVVIAVLLLLALSGCTKLHEQAETRQPVIRRHARVAESDDAFLLV